jgi:hypothetical protein
MKNSVHQKKYHVYVLIDDIDGIFYVGSGNTDRLRSTVSEVKYIGRRSMNKKAQKIREIWEQGREPLLKVVFSSDDETAVRKYESFLIRYYGLRLTNYQGIQSKYPQQSCYEYEWEDEQELLSVMTEPRELESAIEATKDLTAILEDLRDKQDVATDLAKLMKGALRASDNGWLEKNLDRPYLNGFLDDMAQGFIALVSALPQSGRLPEDILEMFRADGIKWLCVEDVIVIVARLTRAGYIRKRK